MKILLSVEHPAWAHQFRYIVKELEKDGYNIKIVAINKDRDLELLDAFKMKYEVISNTAGKNIIEKAFIFLISTIKIFYICLFFKPDLFLGRASPMMSINSFIFQKKHIVFEDSEPAKFSLLLCRMFSTIIITPQLFSMNLGKKQLRINSYKELFYLHPTYFHPDPNIIYRLNLKHNEKLILLRFVSWSAHHDRGQHGISNKTALVNELKKHGKVVISSESPLSPELEQYKLQTPIDSIHSVLFYADLFISDSQTMTAESAIIGTPAIRCNTFVGRKDMTNFIELEKKYGLIQNLTNIEEVIPVAIDMLESKNLEIWRQKQRRMLLEKIDPNCLLLQFIRCIDNDDFSDFHNVL